MSLDQNERVEGWRAGGSEAAEERYGGEEENTSRVTAAKNNRRAKLKGVGRPDDSVAS